MVYKYFIFIFKILQDFECDREFLTFPEDYELL